MVFIFDGENALRKPQSFTSIDIKATFSRRVKDTNQLQKRLWVYFGAKLSTVICQQLFSFFFQLFSLGLDWTLQHLTEQKAAPREVLLYDHISL